MSWEQISSILRHILTFGGGFAVAKGWVSEQTMLALVGAIITIGGAVWGAINKTQTNIVASAAAVPGTTVVTTPEIANAVPNPDAMSSANVKVVAK